MTIKMMIDEMNTMAFINFLLVKIFPTLICQYFHRQNFVPYGTCFFKNGIPLKNDSSLAKTGPAEPVPMPMPYFPAPIRMPWILGTYQ